MDKTKRELRTCLGAKVGLIWIETTEEIRTERMIFEVAKEAKYDVRVWSATKGLQRPKSNGDFEVVKKPMYPPDTALQESSETGDGRMITIFRDLGALLPNPVISRAIRDAGREIARQKKDRAKAIIVIDTRRPPDDIPGITLVDMALPTRSDIADILETITKSTKNTELQKNIKKDREAIISASVGLPAEDISIAIAKSIADGGTIDPKRISSDKKQIVARGGILEWFEPDPAGFATVGGLAEMKDWLSQRRSGFTSDARKYGLPLPKGLLVAGVPGCGKSLTTKACAAQWQMPLIRMDVGAIFGGIVGESEDRMRRAIKTAEAVAPCILWIDELEKGFAGSVEGARSDAGTSSRVFATFLTWMQEKTAGVFVMATANDINILPPEFLRAGRWDEIFFVDLPDLEERKAIVKIFQDRYEKTKDVDLDKAALETEKYTGAEIEAAWTAAMYRAYTDNKRYVVTDDVTIELKKIIPQSKSQEEKIRKMRTWAETRARNASKPEEGRDNSPNTVDEIEVVEV